MKTLKNKYYAVALAAGMGILFACNNRPSDYKNDDDDSISKQDAVIQQSNVDTNAMNNGGSTAPVSRDTITQDTSAKYMDTLGAANKKAKPNAAKKGHKGSARVAIHTPNYTARIEADKKGVYNYAEVPPTFPGGEKQLDKFVADNIQYPQDAMDNGVEGTVYVNFAVDERGNVYSPQVKGGKLGYGLDEEAMNVIKKMPKWTPGSVKGKNVKTYYNLPITFTLL